MLAYHSCLQPVGIYIEDENVNRIVSRFSTSPSRSTDESRVTLRLEIRVLSAPPHWKIAELTGLPFTHTLAQAGLPPSVDRNQPIGGQEERKIPTYQHITMEFSSIQ